MNKIMNESAAKVAGLYKGLTYYDQYGGSVVIVVILTIILFLISVIMWMLSKKSLQSNFT